MSLFVCQNQKVSLVTEWQGHLLLWTAKKVSRGKVLRARQFNKRYLWQLLGGTVKVHYGSVLWRDVSRNGIFWCPILVFGIGYLVLGYIHIYTRWSVIMKTTYGPSQDPIPICMIEYGWWRYALIIWYMVGHHENNIWPQSRPNTNMHDWVWVMEVCSSPFWPITI